MGATDQEGPGPVVAVARTVLGQLLAVVAIAAAITVLVALVGPDDSEVRAGAPDGTAAAPGPSGESGTAPATTPAETRGPSSAPATTSGSPTARGTAAGQPQVDVLNQDAGGGAAGAVADQLRAAGWRIGRVDDFSGTVRTTTVYYPAGMRQEARALARDLPGSQRLLERFSTLSPSRLSVVLVADRDRD